ncbi:hypothetical protein SISSUDRAFT_199359 [Sistotremastrum suecicum HHB10207 ss-3]|uniref:Uncharacterized protein n=1 Tax=Sistotremastrum suecicum HHB10207 ss-3 TaxID=1314776 RepID=A0A166AAA6_9AGAM|nr:hypothetical protein SISSUDRAFT_199359 [Sistotremastrum suecicum HHB10207 ss-3]
MLTLDEESSLRTSDVGSDRTLAEQIDPAQASSSTEPPVTQTTNLAMDLVESAVVHGSVLAVYQFSYLLHLEPAVSRLKAPLIIFGISANVIVIILRHCIPHDLLPKNGFFRNAPLYARVLPSIVTKVGYVCSLLSLLVHVWFGNHLALSCVGIVLLILVLVGVALEIYRVVAVGSRTETPATMV